MSCYYIDLPHGGTAHINVADDIGHESMQAVMAVVQAADKYLQDEIAKDAQADRCARMSPLLCSECPYNEDGGPRCQCV